METNDGSRDARRHTTAKSFEPLRAEPNGFRIHLLNRSNTLHTNRDHLERLVMWMSRGGPWRWEIPATIAESGALRSRRSMSNEQEAKHSNETPPPVIEPGSSA